MILKNLQIFAKTNIWSQTLSKFGRFPESGDKFANRATLPCPKKYQKKQIAVLRHTHKKCIPKHKIVVNAGQKR